MCNKLLNKVPNTINAISRNWCVREFFVWIELSEQYRIVTLVDNPCQNIAAGYTWEHWRSAECQKALTQAEKVDGKKTQSSAFRSHPRHGEISPAAPLSPSRHHKDNPDSGIFSDFFCLPPGRHPFSRGFSFGPYWALLPIPLLYKCSTTAPLPTQWPMHQDLQDISYYTLQPPWGTCALHMNPKELLTLP